MGDFYFSYKVQHLAEFYQGTDLINFSAKNLHFSNAFSAKKLHCSNNSLDIYAVFVLKD